jgi:hypothetical protein
MENLSRAKLCDPVAGQKSLDQIREQQLGHAESEKVRHSRFGTVRDEAISL